MPPRNKAKKLSVLAVNINTADLSVVTLTPIEDRNSFIEHGLGKPTDQSANVFGLSARHVLFLRNHEST
jgi:hypothetical protein